MLVIKNKIAFSYLLSCCFNLVEFGQVKTAYFALEIEGM